MQETLKHLRAGSYTSPNGRSHILDINTSAQGVEFVQGAGDVGVRRGECRTVISVKSQDCLYAAADLHAKGLAPIVLDFANANHPGGAYLGESRAQEEGLCRRTTLCTAIDPQHRVQPRKFYPFNDTTPYAGLYVPNVTVFRADSSKNHQFLDQPFNIGVGVLAACNRPHLLGAGAVQRIAPAETQITRERIRTFLQMACENRHRSVVAGAFGCGVFSNPPDHIAEIFLDVIKTEFPNCFDEIVFAIFNDKNAGRAHNPEGNFAPFKRRVDAYNRA